MKLFRSKTAQPLAPREEALAQRISSRIIRIQQRMASSLNRKAGQLSIGQLRLLFVLFCLLFGSISLYLILSSLIIYP